MFTLKAVVDEIHIRKSANVCNSIFGIDVSQLYSYSMCQPMPTGLHTRYEFDAELQRFKPRQNKSRNFGQMVMSFFQRMRPDFRIESLYTKGTQKKIDCFNADGFCRHCNTVVEAMGCFYLYCPCQGARPALTEEYNQRGTKKTKMNEMRRR